MTYKSNHNGSSCLRRGGLCVYSGPMNIAAAIILFSIALSGCKPSERNYRAAYDVATAKTERENEERRELNEAMGLENGVLQEVDGFRIERLADRDVWTRHINMAAADSVGAFSVSVARFKMPANAEALSADLRTEGFPAARTGRSGEEWYVLIAEGDSPDKIFEIGDRFRHKFPDFHYVGQPGQAILINGNILPCL